MKAVIPAGGLGTRMLPATKAVPKELLPVVDRPAIQHVVEEALGSGIDGVVVVTAPGKEAILEHFAPRPDLEDRLLEQGRDDLLERLRSVPAEDRIETVVQPEPRGLGDAILRAEDAVAGDAAFAVLLPDDIVTLTDGTWATERLVRAHRDLEAPVVGAMEVPLEEVSRYGCLEVEPAAGRDDVRRVRGVVEKPGPEEAPSRLVAVGRYVLEPTVFDRLRDADPGPGGEVGLAGPLAGMAAEGELHACRLEGRRLDVGTVEGFVHANVAAALAREDLDGRLVERLRELVDRS